MASKNAGQSPSVQPSLDKNVIQISPTQKSIDRKDKRVSDVENPALELDTNNGPLAFSEVENLRKEHGYNRIISEEKVAWYIILIQALFHPFNVLLTGIAITSIVADPDEKFTPIVICFMVVMSTAIRFYQEWKSESAVHSLLKLVTKTVTVIRFDDNVELTTRERTIPSEELVPGDWVVVRPGDVVPADAVVLTSKVFFVSEAPLTGEAVPVEKHPSDADGHTKDEQYQEERRLSNEARQIRIDKHKQMSKYERICRWIFGLKIKTHAHLDKQGYELKERSSQCDHVFMGCQVITGMATLRVIRIGHDTLFGRMAEALSKERSNNPFQQGVRRISWIFFITMALIIPPVLILQATLHNGSNFKNALLYSLSVAVGLTPEMLPVIVNACLAKGSISMAQKKSVMKTMDAIINLGAVDILCTDKTGTLTKSVIHVSSHVNPFGQQSYIPLQLAYLNAYFQSIIQNPIDSAITAYFEKLAGPADPVILTHRPSDLAEEFQHETNMKDIDSFLKKFGCIDEIPFDFTRRRLSVLLQDTNENNKMYLVCKGAAEEVLTVCTKVIDREATITQLVMDAFPATHNVIPLNTELMDQLVKECRSFLNEGKRVIAIAFKPMPLNTTSVTHKNESEMILAGFLSFLDPPKESTSYAIRELIRHNVEVKVLTGDSPGICSAICKEIKLPVKAVVTSEEIDQAVLDGTINDLVEQGTIFAKLTPLQKSLVVQTLRIENNHVVAFMGDGVNDAPALKEADVGISVENGVDICRESADIILLDKDLNAVVTGLRIGRETYGNTLKYIAMAVSSNFGNVFSSLCASAWLDFEPMTSLQLLVQNLLYDTSQIAIPWDSMDEEFLMVPHVWKMKSVLIFMVWMGPWSSIFDIATFLFMYYQMGVKSKADQGTKGGIPLFHTEWFMVGLLTQTLIVHMIRTPRIPFIQSNAAIALTIMTILIMAIGLVLPHIPKINTALDLTNEIPAECYYFLIGVLVAYSIAANIAKFIYICIFKEWF